MARPIKETRYIPLSGLQVDIIARLAELLAGKDVPEGVVYLLGLVAPLWDDAA